MSDEDYEYLDTWVWTKDRYVYRNECGKIYMHIEVFKRMGLPFKDVVDHKDRNPLNNQRCNLRAATISENAANRGSKSIYRFRGVRKCNNKHNPWVVHVYGKTYGPFPNEEQAARIRDSLAKAIWGEFAILNFPD